MSNEEFQKLVLQKFDKLESEMTGMKSEMTGMKSEMTGMKSEITDMKSEMTSMKEKIDKIDIKLNAVYDQTAMLTEFKTEVNTKLDKIIEDNRSIHEILGEHEVAIRTLRRRPV